MTKNDKKTEKFALTKLESQKSTLSDINRLKFIQRNQVRLNTNINGLIIILKKTKRLIDQIYALNNLMTMLEYEHFTEFCQTNNIKL